MRFASFSFVSSGGRLLALLLLLPAATCLAADPWLVFEGKEGPGKGKHIVLMSGDEEYRSEEGLPMLAKILARHHGFRCTVLFAIDPATGEIAPNTKDNIPGIEALDSADGLIMLTRFRALPDDQMKHVEDYLRAGKPVIGLRTATHAFAELKGTYAKYNWNGKAEGWEKGFGRKVLGETWVSHHGHHKFESTRGVIVESQKDNPILRGVADIWGPTDVYGITQLPTGSEPLVLGQVLKGMSPTDPPLDGPKNDPMMPVAWTRTYQIEGGKEGRVFTTTMGAANDLACEDLRRLVINAAFWAVGLEAKIPAKADVTVVGNYEPSNYGFNGYRKGVKPADLVAGAEDIVVNGK